jgi:hypothetical protein
MATGTLTKIQPSDSYAGGWRVYQWNWTSSSGGIATDPNAAAKITGLIYQVKFAPSLTATKAGHKCILRTGAAGVDYLLNVGASMPVTATSSRNIRHPMSADSSYPLLVNASVVPEVTGAGASKSGTVYVYVKEK